MDLRRLIRRSLAALPLLALAALLLASLYLAGDAETDQTRLGRWLPGLLTGAAAAALLLLVLLLQRTWRVMRARREGAPGARLQLKLAAALLVLALPPLLLVYGFALRFLGASIDSWFNVRIEQALADAGTLGRLYLDDRLAQRERDVRELAARLAALAPQEQAGELNAALDRSGALRLSLFEPGGAVRAHVSADVRLALPEAPDPEQLAELSQRGSLARPVPLGEDLAVKVLAQVGSGPGAPALEAVFALPDTVAPLTRSLQQSLNDYDRLKYLRGALKASFVLILSLVLLLSILLALLAALALAKRLVQPVAQLAVAAGEIAQGRFGGEVATVAGEDELSFLIESFNRMSRELAQASAAALASQAETERQRAYLDTVLTHLSSGVLSFDAQGRLRTANAAAGAILGAELGPYLGAPLEDLARAQPELQPLCALLATRATEGAREWREEVRLRRGGVGQQVLLLRGAALPNVPDSAPGFVAVFDDATQLSQTNREAAWSEVARRLAHEIKNPLTPIQLAAERLKRRLDAKLDGDDRALLDRTTTTIVAQVEALKHMANAFGDYARPPRLQLAPLDLNRIVAEVLDLYEDEAKLEVVRELAPALPPLRADAGRLRQLLHNLVKNTLEAVGPSRLPCITARTRLNGSAPRAIELEIADNGPGLPADFDAGWFEPYTTTKARGTGLGLAIVKKIAEEHGGSVRGGNAPQGGAVFTVRLPLES